MESEKPRRPTPAAVDKARRLLIIADDTVHIIVAVFLVASAFVILGYAARNFVDLTIDSTLLVVNDVLFVLIIAELLWTIVRYLRREQFSLAPFLFIGIISSLRRILYIDAQMSLGTGDRSFDETLMELGIHVGIIFVLVIAYYLIKRAKAVGD